MSFRDLLAFLAVQWLSTIDIAGCRLSTELKENWPLNTADSYTKGIEEDSSVAWAKNLYPFVKNKKAYYVTGYITMIITVIGTFLTAQWVSAIDVEVHRQIKILAGSKNFPICEKWNELNMRLVI